MAILQRVWPREPREPRPGPGHREGTHPVGSVAWQKRWEKVREKDEKGVEFWYVLVILHDLCSSYVGICRIVTVIVWDSGLTLEYRPA